MEWRRYPCRAIVYKYRAMSPMSLTLRLPHAQHKSTIHIRSFAGALDGGESWTLLAGWV
jgi:hypothetical protein